MPAQIRVNCRGCGAEVQSSEYRDGLCLHCAALQALEPLREGYATLARKRTRYYGRGISTRNLDEQLGRLQQRCWNRIAAIAMPHLMIPVLNQILEEWNAAAEGREPRSQATSGAPGQRTRPRRRRTQTGIELASPLEAAELARQAV